MIGALFVLLIGLVLFSPGPFGPQQLDHRALKCTEEATATACAQPAVASLTICVFVNILLSFLYGRSLFCGSLVILKRPPIAVLLNKCYILPSTSAFLCCFQ